MKTLHLLLCFATPALGGAPAKAPLGIVETAQFESEPKSVFTLEYGYEIRAPLYFGRKDSGEVLLRKETGEELWIKQAKPPVAQPFEDLLKTDHLFFFTQHWDTKLYYEATRKADFSKRSAFRLPDRKLPVATAARPYASARDVEVLERKTVEGQLWLKVKLVERTSCSTADGKPVYAKHPVTKQEVEGWVPAKNDKGELNFWFYTRGC